MARIQGVSWLSSETDSVEAAQSTDEDGSADSIRIVE
jgi:acyl carrier protein